MLQYVLAGLALGAIYAIASLGLVFTFASTGVLNFAFGSMAYVVARFYYWLNSEHGWSTVGAGTVCLLIVGPLLGVVLYVILFRFLRGQTPLVKLVATIGLSVALPPLAELVLGSQTIDNAPGLGSQSDHFLGTSITSDQAITYGFVIFVVVVGTAVLRFTDAGLRVRAMVDSEAMASLSGTNPERVSVAVWAVSAALAGLAGILVAPTVDLTTTGMTYLMAAAFAAVVAARLRSLPIAVIVSFAMGLVTDVIQKYLPANSSFTADIIPSIPFAFTVVFLLYYLARSGSVSEQAGVGGPLDQAIKIVGEHPGGGPAIMADRTVAGAALPALPIVVVAFLPLIFRGSGYWLGLVAVGLCYAVTFLSFTVVTGEGGMLWLSQIIFAGGGALVAAQFDRLWQIPALVAIGLAALVVAAVGAVIGLLTIRLGDLYVGLVTLTFGLLAETLIFTRNVFLQGGPGVTFNRPGFASSDLVFSYLALAVFVVFALLIVNLRRSTSGLALRAVRDSETASRTIGLSVVQVKVIVGAIAAFVAAVGGGFLAMYAREALPTSYETFAGLIWLAVVVSLGVRSITAAALAGLSFSLLPGLFQTYVPSKWDQVPAILFGLGAISVARDPDGVVAANTRKLRRAVALIESRVRGGAPRPVPSPDLGLRGHTEMGAQR